MAKIDRKRENVEATPPRRKLDTDEKHKVKRRARERRDKQQPDDAA